VTYLATTDAIIYKSLGIYHFDEPSFYPFAGSPCETPASNHLLL